MAAPLVDAFALLGQPRRPWLEPDAVKDAFRRLSVQTHPDASESSSATQDFATLNGAQSTLASHKSRLRHLLDLEFADLERDQRIPDVVGDLFLEVAEKMGGVSAFLKKLDAASTPLTQALLGPERLAVLTQMKGLAAELDRRHSRILESVKELDGRWDPARPGAGLELAALFESLSYTSRWLEQARDAVLRLEP